MTNIIAPYVVTSLMNLTVNMSGSLNLSLFLFNYSLETFHINHIYLNYTKTGLNLTGGRFELSIHNFSFDCIAKTNFTTDPQLFFGQGHGRFNLSRLNVSFVMDLKLGKNDLPQIEIISSRVDISNKSLHMLFNGTNDVFTLLEMVQGFVAPLIIDTIGGEMKKETRDSIQSNINDLLAGLPNEFTIPGTNISLNFGLVLPPSMTKGYLPLALRGQFACVGPQCLPNPGPEPTPPPVMDPFAGSGSFQLLISDYMLQTLFIAAYQASLLRFNLTAEMVGNLTNNTVPFNTDLFGVFIPELRQKYGPHRNINMNISVHEPPKVDISPDGMERKVFLPRSCSEVQYSHRPLRQC